MGVQETEDTRSRGGTDAVVNWAMATVVHLRLALMTEMFKVHMNNEAPC